MLNSAIMRPIRTLRCEKGGPEVQWNHVRLRLWSFASLEKRLESPIKVGEESWRNQDHASVDYQSRSPQIIHGHDVYVSYYVIRKLRPEGVPTTRLY